MRPATGAIRNTPGAATGLDIGSVRCAHCHFRGTHTLAWPAEAFYTVSHRQHVLWAFNHESARDVHDYLLSKKREVSGYRWASLLLHIPTVFKTQKARDAVCAQLRRLLAPGPGRKATAPSRLSSKS